MPEVAAEAPIEADESPAAPEKIDLPGKIPYSNVSVTKSPATRDDARLAGYAFLIGKLVTKTLTADDGEVLVREGDRVTEVNLRRTEQAGKLVRLALHSR